MSGRERGKGKEVAKGKGKEVATSKNVTGGKRKKQKVVVDSDDEYFPEGEMRETRHGGESLAESATFWVVGSMVSPSPPDPEELAKADPVTLPVVRDSRGRNPRGDHDFTAGIFCDYRFISLSAHLMFERRKASIFKGANVEKRFPLENEMPQAIKDFMARENLEGWFEIIKDNASSDLMWEIYSNAQWCGHGEAVLMEDNRLIYARRIYFIFSPATIAAALQWPPLEGPCHFEATMKMNVEDLVTEVSKFAFGGVTGAPWDTHASQDVRKWTVSSSCLLRRARWLVNVIEAWVEGVSPQNHIRFEWCVMAMCWYYGHRFDVPKRIYKSFRARLAKDNRRAAGFGYLLKHLATERGAECYDGTRAPEPDRCWTHVPDLKKDEVVVESSRTPPQKGVRKGGKGKAPAVSEESMPSDATNASLEAAVKAMQKMMLANDKKAEARWQEAERKAKSRAYHARRNQRQLGDILYRQNMWLHELGKSSGVTLTPTPQRLVYESSSVSDDSEEGEESE